MMLTKDDKHLHELGRRVGKALTPAGDASYASGLLVGLLEGIGEQLRAEGSERADLQQAAMGAALKAGVAVWDD